MHMYEGKYVDKAYLGNKFPDTFSHNFICSTGAWSARESRLAASDQSMMVLWHAVMKANAMDPTTP